VVNWIDIDADNMKMKDLMDRMVKIVLNVEKKVDELESKISNYYERSISVSSAILVVLNLAR